MPLNPTIHKIMVIGSGPITIGQAEIENNQIWLTGSRFQQAALQRFGLIDAHPVALQRRAQKATNSLFIFNNQNVCHISS